MEQLRRIAERIRCRVKGFIFLFSQLFFRELIKKVCYNKVTRLKEG